MIIVNQTSVVDHFSTNKSCVSLEGSSIGSAISDYKEIRSIDLTKLTGIKPISKDGKHLEPDHKATPQRDLIGSHINLLPRFIYLTVGRVPHLPIWSVREGDFLDSGGVLTPNVKNTGEYVDYSDYTGYKGYPPQKVKLKGDPNVGYLWYLDKNNLALSCEKADPKDRNAVYEFLQTSTYDDTWTWWPHFPIKYEDLPSLGFLIYQIIRETNSWNGIEYIGLATKTKLGYRSGLNTKALNYNNTSGKWYSSASDALLSINGNRLFSILTLEFDLFYWLTIAPPYKGLKYKYFYHNLWDYLSFFPTRDTDNYPSRVLHFPIKSGGKTIEPPYNSVNNYRRSRNRAITEISTISSLGRDVNIEKGDIFFSSLEYEIQEGSLLAPQPFEDVSLADLKRNIERQHSFADEAIKRARKPPDRLREIESTIEGFRAGVLTGVGAYIGSAGGPVGSTIGAFLGAIAEGIARAVTESQRGFREEQATANHFLLDSFMRRATRLTEAEKLRDKVILYLYKGEYRIGGVQIWGELLPLANDSDQIVESVDDTTSKFVGFTHIKQLKGVCSKVDYTNLSLIDDNFQSELLAQAYALARGSKNGKIFEYTEEELNGGTHTFDLEGTDWYLLLHNGSVNLIPKDEKKAFVTAKTETRNIIIPDTFKPSTFEKINQRAELVYYGQSIPLNTKFKFDGDQFSLTKTPIEGQEQYGDQDFTYEHIRVDSANDLIDTWMSLPKKRVPQFAPIDPTNYLIHKERLLQLTTNYEQERYRTQMMLEEKKIAATRQREDLDFRWWESAVGAATKPVGGLAGGAVSMMGGNVLGAAVSGAGAVASVKRDITFLIRYPTFMERVNEDERMAIRQNSQNQYQRRQNYEHDFRIQTLKLNQHKNSFTKPGVSNRDVQEAYNKAMGYEDVNIQVYLPTETQMEQINYIYRTYGCECVSTRFMTSPLIITNGMEEGLYRFSKIEVGGVNSTLTTDLTIRDIIIQIFENGTKFMDVEHESTQSKAVDVVLVDDPTAVFDTNELDKWSRDTWDIYKSKTKDSDIIEILKKRRNYGLTDEEYEQNKHLLEGKTDRELLEIINTIISNRLTGKPYVVTILPKTDLERITALNERIGILEDQLQQKDLSKTILQEKVNDLRTELNKTMKECKDEKDKLEKQLEEARTQAGHKEFSRDILQEKINDLRGQLDTANKSATDCAAERDTLKQQIATLEKQKNRAQKQKKDLDKKVKDLETQITNLNAQIKALQDQMKALEDQKNAEIRQHKIDKEVAEQKWDDKQREFLNEKDARERLAKEKERLEKDLKKAQDDCVKLDEATKKEREELAKRIVDETKDLFDAAGKLPTRPPQIVYVDRAPPDIVAMKNLMNRYYESARLLKEQLDQGRDVHSREIEQMKKEKDKAVTAKNAAIAEQLRLTQELETCRKVGGAIDAATDEQSCQMLHKIIDPLISIEVKPARGGNEGWDAFLELTMAFAERMKRMRSADLEQYLGKYHVLQPLFQKLYDMEQTPMVNGFMDEMAYPYWFVFMARITRGTPISRDPNDQEGRILNKILELRRMYGTHGGILQFKVLFDDAILLATTARGQLKSELENDRDLQFFFKHIFPGELIPLYEELYGDVRVGAAIREFKTLPCTSGALAFRQLAEIIERAVHTPDDIEHIGTTFPPTTIVYNWEVVPNTPIEEQEVFSLGYVCSEKLGENCPASERKNLTGVLFYARNYYTRGGERNYPLSKKAWGDIFEGSKKEVVYFEVADDQKILSFDDVHNARQTEWDNRYNTDKKFPKQVKDDLAAGTLCVTLQINTFLQSPPMGPYNKLLKRKSAIVNIKQVFGDFAEDALRMIIIFTRIGMYVWNTIDKETQHDNLFVVYNEVRRSLSSDSLVNSTTTDEWAAIGVKRFAIKDQHGGVKTDFETYLEFKSAEAFITFIAKCVRDQRVYDTRNTKGGDVLRKYYDTIRLMANDPN